MDVIQCYRMYFSKTYVQMYTFDSVAIKTKIEHFKIYEQLDSGPIRWIWCGSEK